MGFSSGSYPVIMVLLVATTAVFHVNSLQCYQCNNCNTVTSQQLLTCNFTLPVPPTTNPPTNPQNTPPTNAPGPTTTDAPGPTTTDAPGPTVTDRPQSTTVPDGSQSTTETDTTSPSTITTVATTDTDTMPPSSIATVPTTVATDAPKPKELEVAIIKRSAEWDEHQDFLDEECFCENEYCNCGGRVFFYSLDDIRALNLTYVCVTDTVLNNGTTVVNRGCAVKANTTEETCSFSSYSRNCTICESDGCNKPSAAFSLQVSSRLCIVSMFMAFVKI